MTPVPSMYPADEMQCCIDCANGTCQESCDKKLWAHNVVIGYAAAQAVATGPCPGPCPGPCSIIDLKNLHARKGTSVTTFNWLALIQLLEPAAAAIIQELLTLLNPPAPAPAQKP